MRKTRAATAPEGRITVDVIGGLGRIGIDNPGRHNALSLAMWQAIPEAVATLEAAEDVRVVVLTGSEGGAFASGADITEFDVVRADAATSASYEAANAAAFAALRRAEKPTVAVIRRFCMGGGVGLAAACDIRIAADDAVFAIPAARLGLAYPPEAVADIVALIGPSRAKDLFYTAKRIDAATALRIGLVDELVRDDELEAAAVAYVARVSALAPMTQRAVKAAIDAAVGSAAGDWGRARELAELCFESQDYAEGRAAFREKREPVFTGR
ncbi:enoyl-CoA hydratase [Oharaeibacter diazotrophicus]|uniref:Enoyl-CoA hydratase/carnithine racemase n=1 Tax=Oharaeibacter diazotrophicus TaxID=1920512 RepID=A0A4R6RMY6_9HYPH|nr:enoyl-CoA hydratase [Oharaeibacter diazotrophicus]TDP87545.1 enoyl-CoA hydratase/carnithine racemase [Oharaeibacter diazotrophicus]BBE70510.1 putative enoyl-CoA hydratase echA8 [Pleomorphomonas sp. SM30]GLS77256.1 enoyl-CoA hydratase [Oharaeibacter diazotrophicus]